VIKFVCRRSINQLPVSLCATCAARDKQTLTTRRVRALIVHRYRSLADVRDQNSKG